MSLRLRHNLPADQLLGPDAADHLDASEEAGDGVVLGEVDVVDPVDGVDLTVEVLHGGDGVGVGHLGGGVDPEAADDRRRPGAALHALGAVH